MKSIAIYYLKLLDVIRPVALEHGYAIGLHGSLERDLDLIAVPWIKDAKPPRELVEAIARRISGRLQANIANDEYHKAGCPGAKPHGRLTWSLYVGGGPYVDISVMPMLSDEQEHEIVTLRAMSDWGKEEQRKTPAFPSDADLAATPDKP